MTDNDLEAIRRAQYSNHRFFEHLPLADQLESHERSVRFFLSMVIRFEALDDAVAALSMARLAEDHERKVAELRSAMTMAATCEGGC